MPDDAYFEAANHGFAADSLDFSVWDDIIAQATYETAGLVLARVVVKACGDNLTDEDVINLLINLLPWNREEKEETVHSIVSDCVENVLESYWELGDLLINPQFAP